MAHLTEMTAKFEIYFIFVANKGGISPPVVLSRGFRTPLWREPYHGDQSVFSI